MTDEIARFATYVATLGRGPGRSRALTREEARDAMRMLLEGTPDRLQIGAFLMLLRYRGEDGDEIAGLVEGAQPSTRVEAHADLDWPSYGAGRSRVAPWFLLSALALSKAGLRVFMHGSNEFSGGMTVPEALAALDIKPAANAADASALLAAENFAYLPIETLSPRLAEFLGLRRLFGLRSPINTVVRLLDPCGAQAGVDGVFHPPYIETHLAAAERLGRKRLLVLKGGGGEAERNPAKPVTINLWSNETGREERVLPALVEAAPLLPDPDIGQLWRGEIFHDAIEARIIGTVALGLIATGRGGEDAAKIWRTRHGAG